MRESHPEIENFRADAVNGCEIDALDNQGSAYYRSSRISIHDLYLGEPVELYAAVEAYRVAVFKIAQRIACER